MCSGLEAVALAGLVASTAGSVVSSTQAQKQAKKQAAARNAQLNTFLDKNQKIAQEAQLKLADRLQQEAAPIDTSLQPAQDRRTDITNALQERSAAEATPLGGTAPRVVQEAAASSRAGADAEAKQRAEALAKARSFGDMIFNKGLSTQDAGINIDMLRGLSQGEAAILPSQQDLAEAAVGGGGFGIGDILSGVGGLATGLSSAGVNPFGGGSAAPLHSPIPVPRPAMGSLY